MLDYAESEMLTDKDIVLAVLDIIIGVSTIKAFITYI